MPVVVKNMLVRQRETGRTLRIVDTVTAEEAAIDDSTDYVVLIEVDSAKPCMPELERSSKFLERLASRELRVIEDNPTSVDLNKLTPAEARVFERRCAVLNEALKEGPRLYNPTYRAQFARRLSEQGIATRPLSYKTLLLYWKGGGLKQSLVPDLRECGAPGERRVATSPEQKVGPKRSKAPGVGLAMTHEHRRNMRIALEKSPYKSRQVFPDGSYSALLTLFYPSYVSIDPRTNKVNVDLPDCVPSKDQFHYFWKTQHSFEDRLLKKLRKKGFDRLKKVLSSGTLKEVRGPGYRYYIDATVIDVYIVSSMDPNRIIGRPTLYVVVDEFSRLIVGIYIGLEPPCWVGAMLALWNCNIDKVKFCAQYGIDIAPEWWPCGYMPLHLMGDRGELISDQAEPLSKGFNLDVENAPPYRGEAKGVVERCFNTLQAPFGEWLPGWVDKEFERGDGPRPPLSAQLTLHQITAMMIANAIARNHKVIRQYEGAPEQIVQGVEFTPVALWGWGERNLRCDARRFPDEHLVRYLWPEKKLKLNGRGLNFHRGLYYMDARLYEQPWYLRAKQEEQEFAARFHPLDLSQVYLLPNQAHTGMLPVDVSLRSQKLSTASLSEFEALDSRKRQQNTQSQWANRPIIALMADHASKVVKAARKTSQAARDSSLSDAERLRGIRENKRQEINSMNEKALRAAHGITDHPAMPSTPEEDYSDAESTTQQTLKDLMTND
jgi:hypothetical protein